MPDKKMSPREMFEVYKLYFPNADEGSFFAGFQAAQQQQNEATIEKSNFYRLDENHVIKGEENGTSTE